MAAVLPTSSLPEQAPAPSVATGAASPSLARAYLTRLAQLHDEAARTAHLANLLGRTPYCLAVLAASSVATGVVVAKTAPAAALATWLVLVFAAIAAGTASYARAIRAPFALPTLEAFSRDLAATLLYAGFAWGAGAMLVLPAGTGLLGLLAFGAGVPALFAATLRVRDMTIFFLTPAAGLSALAPVLRPLEAGVSGMAAVLVAGVAVAAAARLAEGLTPRPTVPDPSAIPAA